MKSGDLVVLALLAGGGYYAYTQGWLQQVQDLLAGSNGDDSAGLPGGMLAENEALDIIWAWRPDFAAAAGAGTETQEGRRRFVRAWLASAQDPLVIEAGRNPVRYVQLRGWS